MFVPYNSQIGCLPTTGYPRCEIDQTLQGGSCGLSGEVSFKGLLLCKQHDSQLRAQDRIDLLEGIVSCLELCSRSIPLRKNRDLSMVLLAQQAQANRELAQAREDLIQATTFT